MILLNAKNANERNESSFKLPSEAFLLQSYEKKMKTPNI